MVILTPARLLEIQHAEKHDIVNGGDLGLVQC